MTRPAADILVVDDEVGSRRLLTEILSREGYKVRPANGPRAALESALAYPPSLILLDVRMPDMDGFEVCRRLKQDKRTCDVPIIFVSALQDAHDRVQGFEVGGVDFVSKPIEEAEVLARVNTHLQLRSMQLHLEELVAKKTAELVRTNETLLESESKYRAVVEGAMEGILVLQGGQRKYYNPRWLEMIGYSAKEYESLPFLSLVHPGDLEMVGGVYQKLAEEYVFGPLPDSRIITKSGEVKWLSTRGSIIDWDGEPAGMIFIKDVTERQQAEQRAMESESRFRDLVEQSPIVFELYDRNGVLVQVNSAFERLWLLSRDDVLGKFNIFESEQVRELGFLPYFEKAYAGERADVPGVEFDASREEVAQGKSRKRWISSIIYPVKDISGQVTHVAMMHEDITMQRQAELALAQRGAILSATAFAAERFLVEVDWEANIDAILEQMGQATGVSRVYVFQNQAGSKGEILTSQRFEWCAPGILPQIDNHDLQSFPLGAGGFGRWEETLGRGGIIHGHVRAFPESEQQVLAVQDIRSIVVVPVFVAGQWWGFIGFDECQREREWSRPAQDALRTAANTLGAAIERQEVEVLKEAAREALRESEARYRSLVEQAQDGIVVLQDGKIRFANSYIAGLSGYMVEELLDTPFDTYLTADQRSRIADIYRRRMKGEAVPAIYESTMQHKDGSRVYVEFNAGLTTYDGKPANLIIVRDIRERVKARMEVEAGQRLLNLVMDNVPALVSYVDKRERYRFVNERYEQAYGLSRTQLAGKHVQEILGPDGYAAAKPHIAAALAGEAVSYEDVFHYPDTVPRWLSIDYVPDRDQVGNVQGFVGMIRDITEHKRAEEELRKGKERLEEAQRIAQIGDWEHDLRAGEIIWSDEMYRIYGLDPQEYAPGAKAEEEFYHPEDLLALRRAFENLFVAGADLDVEYRIVTRQGKVKACRSRGQLVLDEQGIASHARGTTEDITERKLVEQQIMEYQQRLQALASQLTLSEERERQRIARELHDEVGQTLAYARTALASARKTTSDARREAILDDVSQSLRRAIRDTRDLVFDLSSPLMHEVGLGPALAEWLEEQVSKKHGLQTDFIHDGRRFPLDDDMRAILYRCTRELLANVVKHAQARRVTVRLEGERTLVRIVVQDDGIGFDTDAIPEATKREAGFGLFSIRERMADLNGSLEIQSEPGQGCRVVLTSPVLTN
jgi:PAS domain S-box-containing protein